MNNKLKEISEKIKIELKEKQVAPVSVCVLKQDADSIAGFNVEKSEPYKGEDVLSDSICYDFGEHYTGYLTLSVSCHSGVLDAPLKLKVTFAERAFELVCGDGDGGCELSYSWLQEEIIYVDELPHKISIPRRYAMRYIKIEILAKSFRIVPKIDSVVFIAQTSGEFDCSFEASDPIYKKIGEVSMRTLRECMQNFYEDGPKRDRRLWIGDLRLQALVNYDTFKDEKLVRKCLYQFGAFGDGNEMMPSCIYHKPYLKEDDAKLLDYALIFGATLWEYYEFSKDIHTVEDLYDASFNQVALFEKRITPDGDIQNCDGWWCFVDWDKTQSVNFSMKAQAVYLLEYHHKLALLLNKAEDAKLIENMRRILGENIKKYYNPKTGLFEEDGKANWVGNCYAVLSGVLTDEQGKELLEKLIESDATRPVTPYVYHYCMEAFAKVGMIDVVGRLIKCIWGKMIEYGADTFWEIFNEEDPLFSPYGDFRINSSCHAWSCTPICFIKRYFM